MEEKEEIFMVGCSCPRADDGSKFAESLRKKLRERKELQSPTVFQQQMWSILSRGRSAVCVSSDNKNGGKTLGYLIPLLNSVLYSLQLQPTNAPILIVMAPGYRRVDRIWEVCQWLVNETKLVCQKLYGPDCDQNNYASILNGCDVLVTTPNCFLRAARADFILNLSRCRGLVLDTADQILERFSAEIPEILEQISTCSTEQRSASSLQLILCSLQCSVSVRSFYWNAVEVMQPILLVYPWLEGIAFSTRIKTDAMFCSEQWKGDIFALRHIESLKSSEYRTVIFCCDDSEAATVVGCLGKLGVTSTPFRNWHNGEERVIIATDQNLRRIPTKNVRWIVHYHVPTGFDEGSNSSHFLSRTSLLSGSLEENADCRQTFIFTENNKGDCIKIVRYLQKVGAEIPCQIKNWVSAELEDGIRPLCSKLKLWGFCAELKEEALCCSMRHKISKSDKRWPTVPCIGSEVALEIKHVVGANHFFGRIVKSWNAEGASCTQWESEWKGLHDRISKHYAQLENQVIVCPVQQGKCCALKIDDQYFRVVVSERSKTGGQCWRVLSVDEGWQKEVSEEALFQLPEFLSLSSVPQLRVEIILAGVAGVDKDLDWSSGVTDCIRKKIGGLVLRGQVCLALRDTIWLEQMVRMKRTEEGKWISCFELSRFLVDEEGLGERNPEHLPSLLVLCSEEKQILDCVDLREQLTLRKFSVPPMEVRREAIVRRAFIPLDPPVHTPVTVSAVETPGRFFVQVHKFKGCLDQLERDIKLAVKKNELTKTKRLPRMEHLCVCLYGDSWIRARVKSCDHKRRKTLMFFVDYGDMAWIPNDGLYDINDRLIGQLPFQAVECSLADIVPCAGRNQWTAEDGNRLWKLTHKQNNVPEILFTKVRRKEQSEGDRNEFYVVKLRTEGGQFLADKLIESGIARKGSLAVDNFETKVANWSRMAEAMGSSAFKTVCNGMFEFRNALTQHDLATQIHSSAGVESNQPIRKLITELCRLFRENSDLQLLSSLYECLALACEQSREFGVAVWRRLQEELPPPKVLECRSNLSSDLGGLSEVYTTVYRHYTSFMLHITEILSKSKSLWNGVLCRDQFHVLLVELLQYSEDEAILSNCCQVLSQLATQPEALTEKLCRKNLIVTLSDFFLTDDRWFRPVLFCHLTAALIALCTRRAQTKMDLYDFGVPERILLKLKEAQFLPLIRQFLVCLNVLSTDCPQICRCLWNPRGVFNVGNDKAEQFSLEEVTDDLLDRFSDQGILELVFNLCKSVTVQLGKLESAEIALSRKRTDSSYWSGEESVGDMENSPISTGSNRNLGAGTVLEKMPELLPLAKTWRHPTVLWSQSGDNLKLAVQLRGLNGVEIKCSSTSIFFSAELEDVTYKFGFQLYDAVVPSQCRCQIHGSCVVIKLVKMIGGEWPRLTESTLKLHYVHPDLDVMYCEDTGGASSSSMSPSKLLGALFLPNQAETKTRNLSRASDEFPDNDYDDNSGDDVDFQISADDIIARLQEEASDDSADESGSFNMLL